MKLTKLMKYTHTLHIRRISSKCILKPIPFHLVPYDEQYESRDFKRNVNSYPSLFKKELDTLKKNIDKLVEIREDLDRQIENKITKKIDN